MIKIAIHLTPLFCCVHLQVLCKIPDTSIFGLCKILSFLQKLSPGEKGAPAEVTEPGCGSQARLISLILLCLESSTLESVGHTIFLLPWG